MSASKKKQARQQTEQDAQVQREQKQAEQARSERRNNTLYVVVGALVAVLAVVALVWNSGVYQRSATAVTINGTEYPAAAVQYHLNTVMKQYGYTTNSGTSLKQTIMDPETGYSMFDFLLDVAENNLLSYTALADQARAEGYTIPASVQKNLDDTLANLEQTVTSLGYASVDAFLHSNFGPYMDMEQYTRMLTQDTLVQTYINNEIYSIEYPDSEYETYYETNKNSLDTYTITQFVFQARVPTTDDAGNPIQQTQEEQAALLETQKARQKALAEELMARLEQGEDPAALAAEYDADLYNYEISAQSVGSLVNTAYSQWAFDSARKQGDITLAEYDSTTAYNYYVARFEDRRRDDSPTNDVRHILLGSQEQAEQVLALWQAGEQTEDAFVSLVTQYSQDSASVSNGGMIPDITAQSAYVEPFRSWAIDPARQEGDVEVVNTSYGWHVMYYSRGEALWKETTDTVLRNQDYAEMVDAACVGYAPVRGIGMNFVQG